MTGLFTISLDFELHWGGFEKWPLKTPDAGFKISDNSPKTQGNGTHVSALGSRTTIAHHPSTTKKYYNQYFLNTRQVVPRLLQLFSETEVHATWATVGLLMHANRTQVLTNFPALQPGYQVSELSAYHYIDSVGIGESEQEDPFHYADTLVQQIVATPNQELGSHTFAHYYCNEAGQTLDQFQADLQAAQQAARRYNKQLYSLVFPRNQFNDSYLQVCFQEGIRAVRSNPVDWFWKIDTPQDESKWKRLNRGLDAYFPVGSHNSYRLSDIPVRAGFPVCLPASRLLRPYRPVEWLLNDLKINRIQSEMTRAAQLGEVYHLWWHPHNFGWYPRESLHGLEQIVRHYLRLRDRFDMQSLTMGEITNRLLA